MYRLFIWLGATRIQQVMQAKGYILGTSQVASLPGFDQSKSIWPSLHRPFSLCIRVLMDNYSWLPYHCLACCESSYQWAALHERAPAYLTAKLRHSDCVPDTNWGMQCVVSQHWVPQPQSLRFRPCQCEPVCCKGSLLPSLCKE